jgi:tetratricopeptide (TPR) repeat protein
MKFRNLFMGVAALLLLALTSFAQITAIEGDVKGDDGKGVAGAVIKITRTDIKGNYQVKSDKKGHYIYNGLPMGTYNVTCEVNGKEADRMNGVRTRPGDPTQVPFDLKKASAAAQPGQQAAAMTQEQARGLSADQKKQMDEQMKKREEAIKKNAALNEAYNAGKTALDAGQFDQAVENFSKASELDATQIAVWSNLADAYVKLAKTKTGADYDSNMQKGLDAYGKALALKPDDAGLHNNYALALAGARKFPEAQAELTKAAELDPPQAGKYYYNLGALETNAGQAEPAGESFKKAMEANPPYADAFFQYGLVLMGKAVTAADGKVQPVPGTAEAFQKYLEVAPNGAFADQAKAMLTALGSTLETSYQNPNAPKKAPAKKK